MFSRRRFLPLFAVATFALLAACGNTEKKPVEPKSVEDRFPIKVGDQTVQMQVAILPAETQKGLMYRKALGADEGMIFLFDRPQQMSFWMRNCEIPLDIGYFDPDGKLKEVYPMYPHDERPVESLGVRRFALEMNQGWYRKNGLKPGDAIDLTALAEAVRARGMKPERFGVGSSKP
jgi:uncharacterized membrane protein (UPF0127 family)